MLWGEKPYYSLDYYLKQTFGSKTYKASLDAGFTCPNRMEQSGAADVFSVAEAVQVNLQAAERCQLKSRSTVRLKSLAPFMQSSILHIIRLLQIHMQIWII